MHLSPEFKKKMINFLFRLRLGRNVWSADKAMLDKYGIGYTVRGAACEVGIPEIPALEAGGGAVLPATTVAYGAAEVLRLDYATHGDCVKRWGAIVLPGGRALQTGVNYHMPRLAAIYPRPFGKKRREKLIVAAWPHTFMGYGDFCMCVLPRVCRALCSLTEKERSIACVALPFSRGGWSRQYMEVLGIPRERQIDTLTENFGLARGGEAVTVSEQCGVWAPPSDFADLQALIPTPPCCGKRRIFVQRKGGRALLREDELYASIKDMGFEVLEDRPRTVREQIDLYREAGCVVGPHGAGLSNILWAGPGARLLEVQSISWMIPSFRYLCAMRHMPYRVLIDNTDGGSPRVCGTGRTPSLHADPQEFQRAVRALCQVPQPGFGG